MKKMAKWVVNKKGSYDTSFEISVLRDDNSRGKVSYGWFGRDKKLISHDGGPCAVRVHKDVWREMLKMADRIANKWNTEEQIRGIQ